MDKQNEDKELLPHLFRQEYAKMTAVLCRHFGLKHIEIAEDIASDTFLKASEYWAVNGIPKNPTAWLYTVAKNKTKDYFRKKYVFETKVKPKIRFDKVQKEQDFEYNIQVIADSQLSMLFAVCNPINSNESQICLALQILCGFSVEEIANTFLTKAETIKKRLQRARSNLRSDNFQITTLTETEINTRLETVLRTLYLLFNEGYYSKTSNRQIRIELCSEATRLALLLAENPLTHTTKVDALMALMCFQSSRLAARADVNGEAILFEEQDKSLWDQSLIQRGNYYLVNATDTNEISKYHLEAGIAYWHTTPTDDEKWQHILLLYNQLIIIENSPITALNRIFALAKVYGNAKAILEIKRLDLKENSYYQALLGYLYKATDSDKSIAHYEQAISLTKSIPEKQSLQKEIQLLKEQKLEQLAKG